MNGNEAITRSAREEFSPVTLRNQRRAATPSGTTFSQADAHVFTSG
ncbi:MAG TPA: hypothetical protein VN929_02025 [Burkholderiales bacterium]|nr:hypothetical protein [Burkholderiales bacterium]